MAQAKTKQKKASSGSKTRAKTKAKAKSGNKAKAKANSSTKQKTPAKPKASSNGASSNGAGGIAQAASKAKIPLMAGGAALIGAASGMAYGASHSGGKLMGIKMPRPKRVQLRSRDLRKAAKDVGHFGDQVGQLTSELRRAREEGDGGHASPIEVLLRGLTTRR